MPASGSPTLSVVIPVKDDAGRLERCLEALWTQTVRPDEIVVVDNGSTDLTAQVAEWWAVRCVREARPGIPAAASAGYDAATGDLIARLDADSVPGPDWVERIRDSFAVDEDLDGITGPGRFEELPTALRRVVDVAYMDLYFALGGALAGHPPLFGSNFAMRRSLWGEARSRVHRDDAAVHDDLDLSLVLPPRTAIRVDRDLRVAVSARPFGSPRRMGRAARLGVRTILANRTRILVRIRRDAPDPAGAPPARETRV